MNKLDENFRNHTKHHTDRYFLKHFYTLLIFQLPSSKINVQSLGFFLSLCWYKLTFNSELNLNSGLRICLFYVKDNVWLLSHILKETKELTKII